MKNSLIKFISPSFYKQLWLQKINVICIDDLPNPTSSYPARHPSQFINLIKS